MCYHAVYMCMHTDGCEQPLRRHEIFQERLKWTHVPHLKQLDECLTRSHLCTLGGSHPEGRAVHRIQSLHAVLLCHSPWSAELRPVGELGEYLCFLGCIAREEGTVLSRRQRRGRYIYLFYRKRQCGISAFPHSLSAMCPR